MSKPVDAKAIFQDAQELPFAERSAFLARACGGDAALLARVETLLAADDEAGPFLASPTGDAGDHAAPREQPGESIGHFKLQQQIGEGGFGIVWMAEQQQPVRRQVALKIVKRGMDTRSVVARFEQERQALAMMDHQNIAKVFDGGETPAGLPYFVMELVRGVPITQFCDQQHLDPRERLALFVQVCHAVQHAHQKGIIHRDIKPSNVLVTLHDGVPVPKVIDFGIAKAVHRPLTEKTLFTEFQQMIGTPEYMSPEQAELSGLDIDTRADIYALGVLLYELLTGTLPFDLRTLAEKGLVELLRTIREDEPQKPSTRVSTLGEGGDAVAKVRRTDTQRLGRLLRGDLDWIVMKAIEKDRGRRYVSADAFAADVERYLRDEPVEASPPGRGYRLRKYVRRHRVGVTTTLLVAAALAVGLSAAIWGLLDVRTQRDVSRKETQRANTVLGLIEDALVAADPREGFGKDYRVRQLLDEFVRKLGDQLQGEPEVAASVHRLLGRAYLGLGLLDQARPHLDKALDLRRQLFGPQAPAFGQSLVDLGRWSSARSDHVEAARTIAAGRKIQLASLGPNTPEVISSTIALSSCYANLDELAQAEALAREALDTATHIYGADSPKLVDSLRRLASTLFERDRFDEMEQVLNRALALARKSCGEDSLEYAGCLIAVAQGHEEQSRFEQAEQPVKDALAIYRQKFGEEHPTTCAALVELGEVVCLQRRLDEAEGILEHGLEVARRICGGEGDLVCAALTSLAHVPEYRGHPAESVELLEQAIAIRRKSPGNLAGFAAELYNLAVMLQRQDRTADAQKAVVEALGVAQRVWGNDHTLTAVLKSELADLLEKLGDVRRAEQFARESVATLEHRTGRSPMRLVEALFRRGHILSMAEKPAEAESDLRRALDLNRDPRSVPEIVNELVAVLGRNGKFPEAAELQSKTIDQMVASGADQTSVLVARANLAEQLTGLRRYDEAVAILEAIIEQLRGRPDDASCSTDSFEWQLANTLARQGKRDRAIASARQAAEHAMQSAAPASPVRAKFLNNLAQVLQELGVREWSAKVQIAALEMYLQLQGENGLGVLRSRANLAVIRNNEGDPAAAETLFLAVIPALSARLGDDDPVVLQNKTNLAITSIKLAKWQQAADLLREVHATLRRKAGEDEPFVVFCRDCLIEALTQLGEHAENEPLATTALASARRRSSGESADVVYAAAQLAATELELGKREKAEPYLREFLEHHAEVRAVSPQHWNTSSVLGASLAGAGRFAEAEPLLRDAYEAFKAMYEAEPYTSCALGRLIRCYESWGKTDEAAKWRQVRDAAAKARAR